MGKLETVYTLSLYELSKEYGISEKIYDEYKDFYESLFENEDFKKFITNPRFSKDDKKCLIEKICVDFDKLLVNYFKLLIDKRREELIIESFFEYEKIYFENSGIKKAIVETSEELSDLKLEELRSILERKFNKKVILNQEINNSLIMGFKIFVDGKILDMSLDGKFNRLKTLLKNN